MADTHHHTCPFKGTQVREICRATCPRTHCTGKASEGASDGED